MDGMKTDKLDIDIIKWMVEYAEGFEYFDVSDVIKFPDGISLGLRGTLTGYVGADWEKRFNHVYYPLLLQRAIEGVNKNHNPEILCDPRIYQEPDFIKVYLIPHGTQIEKTEYFQIPDNADEAKTKALKYVKSQESINA